MITVILGTLEAPHEYRLSVVGELAELCHPDGLTYNPEEIRKFFGASAVYPNIGTAHDAARKLKNALIHVAYL
jgi:hypothetical protein